MLYITLGMVVVVLGFWIWAIWPRKTTITELDSATVAKVLREARAKADEE